MEELNSQSSFDRSLDITTNPPEGLPDGTYTYKNVDALYKKQNGKWFKKIGDLDYVPLQSGDVDSRVKLLEEGATPVPEEKVVIDSFTNIQDIDQTRPVQQYNEVFQPEKKTLLPEEKPVKQKQPQYRVVDNNGVQSWQKKKEVKIQETIDPKTGQPMGMSYVDVYEDVIDPKTVAGLNKKNNVQASTSKEQQIFTGYPGKVGTEYIVNDDNLWEVKRPGSDEFLLVSTPGAVKALNNQFKQNAEIFDDKKAAEIKDKNNYLIGFNARLNNINKDLIGGSEEAAIEKLNTLFPEFKFEQFGIGTDNIKVSKIKNGVVVDSEKVALDNFFDEDDNINAEKLKQWLRQNVNSNVNESYLKYIEATADLENRVSNTIYGEDPNISKVVSDATALDKTILNEQVRRDISGMSSVLFPEETKNIKETGKQLTVDYARKIKETYARTKDKTEAERRAAFAEIKTDDIIINAGNNYSNQVKDTYNTFISQQKEFRKYVDDIDSKVKSGEISREDYENNYKQNIYDGSLDLIDKSKKIQEDLSAVDYFVKGSEKAIASNLMIKEMTGTFAGGLGRSIVDGAFSIPTFIAGMNSEQRNEFVDSVIGVGTTKEYMQSEDRYDLTTAAFSMAKSLSAIYAGQAIGSLVGLPQLGGYLSLYAMNYNEMRDSLDGIKGAEISSQNKVLMSAGYAVAGAALENFGISYLIGKSFAKKAATSWILKNAFSQIGKNASKEMIEAQIMNSTKLYVSKFGITTAGSALVEGGVESTQAGAQRLVQEAYDVMKGTDYFNNESAWEIVGDIANNGYQGMLGAGIVETVQQSADVLSRGTNALKNKDQINLLIQSADLDGIDKALLTNLKASMLNGKISKAQAKDIVRSFEDIKGKIKSMPEDMSVDNKSVALDLMIERDNINKKIDGKDPFLVLKEKERIGQINEQLKNLGNAVQEPSTEGVLQREQEGVTETGGERGGVEPIVQGEEVTRKGETKAVQEEVVIDKPVIQSNSKTEVDRVKSLSNDAEDGATFNLDGTKYDGQGLIVPVVSKNTTAEELTPEMISDFVEEHKDKIGDNETVKVGIYKFPNSNQVSIDLNILAPESAREQAIEFGKNADQESLFDLSTFENVKTGGTGVNPAQFNNEQFREISKAFREGRVPNVFAKQPVTQIEEVTITPETSQTVTDRINKETDTKRKKVFTAVQKVLSAIPNSRIILHDNTDAFVAGVAKSANITNDEAVSQGVQNNRGSYVNGDIHINLETAGVTTVFHEAFHDLLSKKGMDDNALLDMAKGLKSVISDKGLKTRLDSFVSNYEQGERAEEYTTELGAIMAEAQKELSTTKFQQFKTLVNKIAKKLGLPVVFSAASTAQDAVDFMNSMSGKLGRGEQIEVGKKVGKKVGNTGIKAQGVTIMKGEESMEKYGLKKGKNVTRKIGEALESRQRAKYGKIDQKDNSPEARKKISNWMVDEVKYFIDLMGDKSGKGWYGELYQKSLDAMGKVFPEMKNDQNARDLFTMLVAITSDGQKVMSNFKLAAFAYDYYKKNGSMPKTLPGQRVASFEANLKRINDLLNKYNGDIATIKKDLMEVKSIEEINKERKKEGLEPLSTNWPVSFKAPFAASVFGPKLGMFYSNLSGNEAYPTLDRWWSRTFNRYRGTLIPSLKGGFDKKGEALGLDRFKKILGNPEMSNEEALLASKSYRDSYAAKGYKNGTEIEKAANTIYKIAFENLNDAPFTKNDRQFMYDTISDAVNKLNKQGYDLSIADVQAILWYFEKNLYKTLGVQAKIEGISYEDAANYTYDKWIESGKKFDYNIKDTEEGQAVEDEDINDNKDQISKIKAQKTEPVAGNKLFNEPLKDAETIAKSYMKSVGMEYVPVEKITKLDENLSKRISDAYDKMKNDPNDPQVKKAYEAMAKETLDQYDQILEKGYNVEINNNEPYSSSEDMINDLRDNKRMKIFSTESGFGDEPITEEQRKENPLLRDSGRKDINGETLLVNDVFRFVHDFFGHAKLGNSFGPIGEENAWRVHSEMYSPEARKAMTSETRGQNSWVNFSGVNDAVFKKRDKARELRKQGKIEEADQMVGEVYEEMKFADQKVGLLPDFAIEEGRPSKIKAQKQSKEDAIQDAKDKYELSVEKRGKDHKTGVTAAISDLQKSDWYRDSDDTQREEAIREIRKFFGEKLKAAPSVAKVMGKTKQTAFVSDLAAAIRDQVKLQARSSRETAKDINDRRKALGESIKEVVKSYKGKITEKQLNAINRRIASVNLFNQEMVERVVDYVNKVMSNAEYAGKVNNAFAERRAIRRMMKSGNMTETVAVAKEFVQIDPSMVEDIDTYLEVAAQIRGAVKSSKRVKDSVSLKQIVNFGEAYEYIKPTLERQEEMMKNMRLAEYNDLVDSGVISKDMTLREINKIINNIRNNEDAEIKANEEAAAMEFLKDKLGYIKTLLRISPLKGYNPVTGEQIEISERHSNMINNIIKSNLDDLSLKQMIDMVDSLNNFYENGAVGGLEAAYETILGEQNAKLLEKNNVIARPLKMYFNKKLGQIFGTELTSLNELFNRMFVGTKKGIDVMIKSGFSDVIIGANKARRQIKEIQDIYVKEFGKTKDFFQIENVYERGAFAFLSRNLIGNDAEVKSEFNRRVDLLLESVESLKNGTAKEQEMAKVYEKLLDKMDVKSRDLNTIAGKMENFNLNATQWWINEWSKHYSDLSDVSRSVYNTILGKDINYTPDRYKSTTEGSKLGIDDNIVERNSAFLINTDSITDTNESGVMIASVRPKVLPKGRYVSLDFDMNNVDSLTGALVDINTAGAIRRVDSFFKSKSFKAIVPTVEDRKILTERVNKYIRRSKNKLSVPSDVFRNIDNALNTVSSVGTALGLGGVLQSVKQTVSVAISTAIQTGTSFNIYAGEDFNNWLNTTGASVTNRGQESLTAIESTNKKLKSFNGTFDKAIDTYKNLTQWQLKLFLSRPDVFVARAAFKSYYEQFLKSKGYDVSKINWSTWNETIKKEGLKELNDAAVIYADTMVSRQQNVSDERLAGELLASEDSARKLIRKVLLPFASFSINQRARLVADINALFLNWNNISPEDKAIAIKSIAGTTAEQGVFQMINFGIGMALYWVAQSITGHDDDDEEWKKRINNATKYPLKSLLADMTSPNPLADDAVIFGADQLLAMFGSPSEGEIKQAINDEKKLREMLGKEMTESQINKFKEQYIKDNTYQLAYNFTNSEEGKYGMFSIAADQYLKLAENSEMATNGTFTDDYMGKQTTKYLTDKDKSLAKSVFYGLEVPYTTGAALKEMGQVANKTYSIIKKRALTENQYNTYKRFKKEFKREPQEWEIKMIKSTNSPNKAINELGFIQYMGGLSPKQGEEYLKVFKKFGENGLYEDDYKMIVKNKSADYIIKKALK